MTSRNEAAEDLRMLLLDFQPPSGQMARRAAVQVLDQALAAERRATVERIREALLLSEGDPIQEEYASAVLDEEAAR